VTRRTKIVATLGPASSDAETIGAMLDAGMNVARISLAHTKFDDAMDLFDTVRRLAAERDLIIATMLDVPGPLVRIGRTGVDRVELESGDTIELRSGNGSTVPGLVYVDHPDLVAVSSLGDRIHLGESAIVEVTGIADDHLTAEVVFDGMLTGRGAVKLPGDTAALPVMTDRVRDEVARFVDAGIDIVVVSARWPDDLRQLDLGIGGPMLVAKIESKEAYGNLPDLIPLAGGIVIGRGGLGLDVPMQDLPHIQRHITEQCIASGLPVTIASQMLDSMISAPTPTRAEATDVSNAILEGASAVMLSAETAIGADPALVVETMGRIAARADDRFDHRRWSDRIAALRMAERTDDVHVTITDATTMGAAQAAENMSLTALVCITTGGFTARSMARFRPRAAVIGVSDKMTTVRQLAASWGVTPVVYQPPTEQYVPKVDAAIERCRQLGLLHSGDLVGVVTGVAAVRGGTDTFRILRVP